MSAGTGSARWSPLSHASFKFLVLEIKARNPKVLLAQTGWTIKFAILRHCQCWRMRGSSRLLVAAYFAWRLYGDVSPRHWKIMARPPRRRFECLPSGQRVIPCRSSKDENVASKVLPVPSGHQGCNYSRKDRRAGNYLVLLFTDAQRTESQRTGSGPAPDKGRVRVQMSDLTLASLASLAAFDGDMPRPRRFCQQGRRDSVRLVANVIW